MTERDVTSDDPYNERWVQRVSQILMERVISEPDIFLSDGGCTRSLPTMPRYPGFTLAGDLILNINNFDKTHFLYPR